MKQVTMLKKAMKGNYIVPAFNFANYEILIGILNACKELKSPVILQISETAMDYFTDDVLAGMITGIRKIKLPISVHLDHGKDFNVIKRAIKLGFDSVMIDGSRFPFEQNIKITKKVVEYAHARGVSVEGELGQLNIADDDGKKGKERFTSHNEAKEFVLQTGIDSLAVAIGTNHGINKYAGEPKIHYDILKKIEQAIPNTPIVLHGASLIDSEYVEKINQYGGEIKKSVGNKNLLKNAYKTHIAKINMDSDFRLAYTASVREFLANNPSKYTPRDYGTVGIEECMKCATYRIINICHSNGKA